MAESYLHESVQRWHCYAGKVCLLDNAANNEVTGHVEDETEDDVLVAQHQSNTDAIEAARANSPAWDLSSNQYFHEGNAEGSRFTLKLFEPVHFHFNAINPCNNYCFLLIVA